MSKVGLSNRSRVDKFEALSAKYDKKVDDFDRACKLLEKILHFMEYYEREVETADNVSCNVEIDEVVDFLKEQEWLHEKY